MELWLKGGFLKKYQLLEKSTHFYEIFGNENRYSKK